MNHWNRHAAQWQHIGPPLRPAREDIRILEEAVAGWASRSERAPPRALLLGVTPEIARMKWPRGTRLLALDRSLAMIREVWPAPSGLEAHALCADWRRMPLGGRCCDIVVGDGCFSLLDYPAGYRAALQAIRRVLAPRGLFAMRFFLRPERPEDLGAVFDDLFRGRIGNFHIFKWRLAMALHGDIQQGVRLADIWEAWNAAVPRPERLAAELGWPLPTVATIDAYRGVDTRYTFPTLAEARAMLEAGFAERLCHVPDYELGQRCPTIFLEATP